MGGACGTYGRQERWIQGFCGKTLRKRAHVRRKHRWEDSSKVDLHEMGRGGMDWIDLGQDRDMWRTVVNTVMNFPVP